MSAVVCRECGAAFSGSRREARRARWEPWSTKTQAAIDAGPMVCPECVGRIIDDCLAGMLAASKAGLR